MNAFPSLLLLFIIVPIFEIYLLISVGSVIGVLPTVTLVIFTAVLGTFLIRSQGLTTLKKLQNMQNSLFQAQAPAVTLLEGVLILLSGALLLTPGFFTDTIGFACLIPPLRRKVAEWFIKRFLLQTYTQTSYTTESKKQPRSHITIEGEYRRDDK